MDNRTLELSLPVDFEDGKSPPASMRMCSCIGRMQDPDVPGPGGVIEVMQYVGGFGFELWHADGRKLSVPLAAVVQAACRNLLDVKTIETATEGRSEPAGDPRLNTVRAAYHALRSYQHGNAATELAANCADNLRDAFELKDVLDG